MVPEKKPEEPEEPKGPAGMGYLMVILVVLLLVSAPIFVAYTFLTDEEQDDGEGGGNGREDEDYWYDEDYTEDGPSHNQFLIKEDTVWEDREIILQDNVSIIDGATLRIVNCTVKMVKGMSDLDYYIAGLGRWTKGITVSIGQDSTLHLDGCSIDDPDSLFDTFRVIKGGLYAEDTMFEGSEISFYAHEGMMNFDGCEFRVPDNWDFIRILYSDLNIIDTVFDGCWEGIYSEWSDVVIRGSYLGFAEDALTLYQSNASISDTVFDGSYTDDQYGSIQFGSSGSGISIQEWGNDLFRISILVQGCKFQALSGALYIGEDSLGETPDVLLENNIIENCTDGFSIGDDGVTIRGNMFTGCRDTALNIKSGIDTVDYLDDNTFRDNEAVLEQHFELEISVPFERVDRNQVTVDIVHPGGVANDVWYNVNRDHPNEDDRLAISLLHRLINQDTTEYDPYPYTLLIYADGHGVANITIDGIESTGEAHFEAGYDLQSKDDGWFCGPDSYLVHNDGEDVKMRFRFHCRGMNVTDVTARTTLDGVAVDTRQYALWELGQVYEIDVPLESLGEGIVRGELAVEVSSSMPPAERRQDNNVISTKIFVIGGNLTLRDETLDTEVVYINGGNVVMDNVQPRSYGICDYWLVGNGSHLTVTNSSNSDSETWPGIYAYNSTMRFRDSVFDGHLGSGFTNSTVSMERTTLMSGLGPSFSDCSVSMDDVRIVDQNGFEARNSRMDMTDTSIMQINDVFFTECTIRANGGTFEDVPTMGTYRSDTSFEEYNFHDVSSYFESPRMLEISDSIVDSCDVFSIRGGNGMLTNVTFKDNPTALEVIKSNITQSGLEFVNNTLDLRLTGRGPAQAFDDVTGATKEVNSVLVFDFVEGDLLQLSGDEFHRGNILVFDSSTGEELKVYEFSTVTGMTLEEMDERRYKEYFQEFILYDEEVPFAFGPLAVYEISVLYYSQSVNGTIEYADPQVVILDFGYHFGWQKMTIEPLPPGQDIHWQVEIETFERG